MLIPRIKGLCRALTCCLIGVVWVPLAQAQSEEGNPEPPPSPAPRAFRFTAGIGFTNGGDDIVLPDRRGGPTLRIRAGQLQMNYVGFEYQASPRLSTQVTLGLHLAVDRNKLDPPETRDVLFVRVPVEVLQRYHLTPRWNVAAGMRVALGAAVIDVQNATTNTYRFNDAVSPVVETEVRYWPQVGIKLRYVSERFRLRHGSGSGNDRIDASHVGLLVGAYI